MFEPHEFNAISHHLRVVAKHYLTDVKAIQESHIAEPLKSDLIDQYKLQAKQAVEFADKIDAECI